MKLMQLSLLLIILIGLSAVTISIEATEREKRYSTATKFIAQFLKGLGIKVNSKKLAKLISQKCKNLSKSNMISSMGNRISKISKGLKKLKKLKANAGHKKSKFYKKIGKSHIVTFFSDTFKRLKRCSVLPKTVIKAMTKAQKVFKKILWGKCKKGKKCRAFNHKKVGRVMRRVSALAKKAKGKKQRKRKSRKSRISKNRKRGTKRSRNRGSRKRRNRGGKRSRNRGGRRNRRSNKRSRKIKRRKGGRTVKTPFKQIGNTLGKMLRGFMKTDKKAFRKFKKSLKKSSKKLKRKIKKVNKKVGDKNDSNKNVKNEDKPPCKHSKKKGTKSENAKKDSNKNNKNEDKPPCIKGVTSKSTDIVMLEKKASTLPVKIPEKIAVVSPIAQPTVKA